MARDVAYLRSACAIFVAGEENAIVVGIRSEEHTSELQSPCNLVCRLLLEKKKPFRSRRAGGDLRAGSRPARIFALPWTAFDPAIASRCSLTAPRLFPRSSALSIWPVPLSG